VAALTLHHLHDQLLLDLRGSMQRQHQHQQQWRVRVWRVMSLSN
jgi:hypothetical protein